MSYWTHTPSTGVCELMALGSLRPSFSISSTSDCRLTSNQAISIHSPWSIINLTTCQETSRESKSLAIKTALGSFQIWMLLRLNSLSALISRSVMRLLLTGCQARVKLDQAFTSIATMTMAMNLISSIPSSGMASLRSM